MSHLLIQCLAGSFGGFTTTIITNPLDIIRARLQVQRLDSFTRAAEELWREEHFRMFFKGLSARLVQSAAFSFSIILGYETIKRISVNEQYKHMVRWWTNIACPNSSLLLHRLKGNSVHYDGKHHFTNQMISWSYRIYLRLVKFNHYFLYTRRSHAALDKLS